MLTSILQAFLAFSLSLLFWQFLGYPLFMALISRIPKGESTFDKDYSYQPFISILVPTYNEEKVIERRIENLLFQNYPRDKFEIIVVDSGSTDDTLNIARRFEREHESVKVVDEGERRGKASAINFGVDHAKGEIILVTDANTTFGEDALREIAPHFEDPGVGAVGGYSTLSNIENELVNSSSFYWDIESLMRRGESRIDSACLFHGEINAWRREIVKADVNSLAEDLDMAIQIRKQGYKIAYEPNAIAYEPGPTTTEEQIVQKKRITIGVIQDFFKHRRYLWLPHDKYSTLIFPSHKALQIFSPYLLTGALAVFATLLILQEFNIAIAYVSAAAVIFLILFLALYGIVSKIRIAPKPATKTISPHGILNLVYYVLLHEYIVLLAWKDFVLRRYAVTWQKAETNR